MNDDGENNYGIDADAELASRLHRLRPAALPPDLMQRLRAAEPPPLPEPLRRQRMLAGWPSPTLADYLRRWRRQPWPLAYAGLLAAWALILVLHLLTMPFLPPAADRYPATIQARSGSRHSPAFADNPSMTQTFLFVRNRTAEEAWP